MRLTNHDLNRNTSAAVAIRKALKEKENLLPVDVQPEPSESFASGIKESGEARESASQISGIAGNSLGGQQLPPCNLDYAFKDIQRRFGIK